MLAGHKETTWASKSPGSNPPRISGSFSPPNKRTGLAVPTGQIIYWDAWQQGDQSPLLWLNSVIEATAGHGYKGEKRRETSGPTFSLPTSPSVRSLPNLLPFSSYPWMKGDCSTSWGGVLREGISGHDIFCPGPLLACSLGLGACVELSAKGGVAPFWGAAGLPQSTTPYGVSQTCGAGLPADIHELKKNNNTTVFDNASKGILPEVSVANADWDLYAVAHLSDLISSHLPNTHVRIASTAHVFSSLLCHKQEGAIHKTRGQDRPNKKLPSCFSPSNVPHNRFAFQCIWVPRLQMTSEACICHRP